MDESCSSGSLHNKNYPKIPFPIRGKYFKKYAMIHCVHVDTVSE